MPCYREPSSSPGLDNPSMAGLRKSSDRTFLRTFRRWILSMAFSSPLSFHFSVRSSFSRPWGVEVIESVRSSGQTLQSKECSLSRSGVICRGRNSYDSPRDQLWGCSPDTSLTVQSRRQAAEKAPKKVSRSCVVITAGSTLGTSQVLLHKTT